MKFTHASRRNQTFYARPPCKFAPPVFALYLPSDFTRDQIISPPFLLSLFSFFFFLLLSYLLPPQFSFSSSLYKVTRIEIAIKAVSRDFRAWQKPRSLTIAREFKRE